MKKVSVFLILLVSFIYMEFLYKIYIYEKIFRISIINMILYLVPLAIIFAIISRLFKKEKVNKIVYFTILGIISIWFSAQYVVKNYFDFYISFSALGLADQVADFFTKAVIETIKRLPGIILIFVPFILSIIFNKKINFTKISFKKFLLLWVFVLVSYGIYLLGLNIEKDKDYSAYKLYYKVNDISLSMENLGVLNTFTLDVKRCLFGFNEEITIDSIIPIINHKDNKDSEEEKVYEYNNLDINFDDLISNESNSTIKSMHEYFKNNPGTLQNEYTGIFKDKNLILFMAESFNEIAVNETLTPTLYKLVNSGFTFDHYYTPTIYSTIGGEFQELTGLYAQSTSILGKFRSGDISFPQGIANKFKEVDYKTFAYHNNSYAFQDRNKYLASMGFDNFKACYNGLEKLINCKEWPQSDVAMINATVEDFINEDKFMVFYASVSGHAGYSWAANAQARKNKEEYLKANLSYSEGPASYIAAQMELDRALEELIKKLEEAGKLDDTVIALVGDHYPYELTVNEVNEVSSYKKDSIVEINHSNFILWNNKMDTVKISKVGSQIDVIPTIYNAFNIKYDSRLFIGNDILSNTPGLAIFANRSWVSDKGTYFSANRQFVPVDGAEIEEGYVDNMNKIVNNRINMSKLIIENNYYKKVLK